VHEIHQILAPRLGQIKPYEGQCTPDDFIQHVTNVFESARNVIMAANNANAGGNPAINTPATFTIWLHYKYREVMIGNAELALQSLIQEKFNLTDSPDVDHSIGSQSDFHTINKKCALSVILVKNICKLLNLCEVSVIRKVSEVLGASLKNLSIPKTDDIFFLPLASIISQHASGEREVASDLKYLRIVLFI
ncbi:1285_t:CDS:2, partial [Funneliformis caledonium]